MKLFFIDRKILICPKFILILNKGFKTYVHCKNFPIDKNKSNFLQMQSSEKPCNLRKPMSKQSYVIATPLSPLMLIQHSQYIKQDIYFVFVYKCVTSTTSYFSSSSTIQILCGQLNTETLFQYTSGYIQGLSKKSIVELAYPSRVQ